MNSTALGKLSKLDFIDEINIPPSPGDSGASIGAAYFAYMNKNKTIQPTIKIEKKLFPGFSNSKDDLNNGLDLLDEFFNEAYRISQDKYNYRKEKKRE